MYTNLEHIMPVVQNVKMFDDFMLGRIGGLSLFLFIVGYFYKICYLCIKIKPYVYNCLLHNYITSCFTHFIFISYIIFMLLLIYCTEPTETNLLKFFYSFGFKYIYYTVPNHIKPNVLVMCTQKLSCICS